MINHMPRSIKIVENGFVVIFIIKFCKYLIKYDISRLIPHRSNVNIVRNKLILLISIPTFFTSKYFNFKIKKTSSGRISPLSKIVFSYSCINSEYLLLMNNHE